MTIERIRYLVMELNQRTDKEKEEFLRLILKGEYNKALDDVLKLKHITKWIYDEVKKLKKGEKEDNLITNYDDVKPLKDNFKPSKKGEGTPKGITELKKIMKNDKKK